MLSTRTVTTTGHGSVSVPRDAAVLSVAAVHRAATLSEALAGAESARAAVVAVARTHVDPSAIRTQGLATWPRHDDAGRTAGYEARHSLEVRCAGLEVAAALLQQLADEAGDRLSVDGVSLASTPSADHLADAREAAYADATSRAEHLARLAGTTLGAVVSVTEGVASGQVPFARDAVAASSKAVVGFEGGTEDVSTAVTVTWELG
ncbi:SIMPL domain-containing protein [Nocardioides sp.]|uniref:SIMPL domain-containing protein n=1 Tax=Nocardioides sp. TaxID=35761 RepID=UPI00271D4A0F|nr:SIMPL domain-containing protein [Nocardioides sp.]MDO9454738.1 SIMPL domain-containing protein [Nocardioides sp.]